MTTGQNDHDHVTGSAARCWPLRPHKWARWSEPFALQITHLDCGREVGKSETNAQMRECQRCGRKQVRRL